MWTALQCSSSQNTNGGGNKKFSSHMTAYSTNEMYAMPNRRPVHFRNVNLDNDKMAHCTIGTKNRAAIVNTVPQPCNWMTDSCPSLYSIIAVMDHGMPKHRTIPIELAPIELAIPVPVCPKCVCNFSIFLCVYIWRKTAIVNKFKFLKNFFKK